MMNLTFWTNTIDLRPIRYREVCKQIGVSGKGMLCCAVQFLPALQLPFGSGLADNHTRLWPYKEGQSKACMWHLHLTLDRNDGCKKTMLTLCVLCNFNPQSTYHWICCLSLEKSIRVLDKNYTPELSFKPLKILSSNNDLFLLIHEARSLQIPSYRNNLHANSVSVFLFFISVCCSYLLLVFPLRMEPGLYAFPGFLESLSLGHLCWVVGTHAYNVCTGEDENIGDQL